jgi:hypothetical protein
MNNKSILIENIDKIHTTELGAVRISKNLKLDENVVDYCKKVVENEESTVIRKGKNYYVTLKNQIFTINSSSYTIITAHLKK